MSASEPSDEDLIRAYCDQRPDPNAGEILIVRFRPRLLALIKQMTYFCPKGADAQSFIDGACARAEARVFASVCKFTFSGSLAGWLAKVAKCAVLDERRFLLGRGPRPSVMSIDADESGAMEHAVSHSHAAFVSLAWMDPSYVAQARERSEILDAAVAALCIHAQRSNSDLDSAGLIRHYFFDEWPAREIAHRCGRGERTVYRDLEVDLRAVRTLLKEQFGISIPAEI